MPDLDAETIDRENERSLTALCRAMQFSQGQFSLVLVRCNYSGLRHRLIQQLHERCPVPCATIHLPESTSNLFTALQRAINEAAPLANAPLPALLILGLESLSHLDQLFVSANQLRDSFPKSFQCPLVLWLNDWLLQKLTRLAPDFKNWAGSAVIDFDLAIPDLISSLRDHCDRLFATILNTGDEQFPPNWAVTPPANSLRRTELEFALSRIQASSSTLDPSFQASLNFLQGQEAHTQGELETAQQYYEKSLQFWLTRANQQESPSAQSATLSYPPLPTPYTERAACVLIYLGLLWRAYAVLQRVTYQASCRQARSYFQQGLDLFERINRQDLVAKFVISAAEVLQKLGQWDELSEIATRAIYLHKLYKDQVRQARDHGFLAEVALARADWRQAKAQVEMALGILADVEQLVADHDHPHPHLETSLDIAQRYHYGWYLLLLARAQAELGEMEGAIAQVEIARDRTFPKNDPLLYIQILQTLQQLYFYQKHYLKAFHTKQFRRSIEQQYGFRAFVGALRLEPQPSLLQLSQQDVATLLAQEIAASGRQQDVNRLLNRLNRNDIKLTVIHGPSGVGKSSIVNAGLVPALQDYPILSRTALPVLVNLYTDWQTTLATMLNAVAARPAMSDSLANNTELTPSLAPLPMGPSPPLPALLTHLTRNNYLPVLIFDQFEEFFVVYDTIQARRPFYEFLRDAITLPFVKVILVLREDYLHYLLELQRLTNLDIINNDILSKEIRYPLDDFTPADARAVIHSLTTRAQFYLDDELVDELVRDLAGELGTIRPIELQIVGAQLQATGINTLAEYQRQGPKEKLVESYLEDAVRDCGRENEDIARIVLFLLTNEKGTRPLKTRDDLEADLVDLGLPNDIDKLDLVLEVLVGSGLVFFIPESPADRYQLVHDYLVSFIRKQQEAGINQLKAELGKEQEPR